MVAVDFFLSQFPALETFVVETDKEPLRSSFAAAVDVLVAGGQHLQVLDDVAKMRYRTCEEAQRHASLARKAPTRLANSDRLASSSNPRDLSGRRAGRATVCLISPFWFHDDYGGDQSIWRGLFDEIFPPSEDTEPDSAE